MDVLCGMIIPLLTLMLLLLQVLGLVYNQFDFDVILFQSKYGNYTLSAMTSGIRQNWVQAISKCIDINNHSDMGKIPPHTGVNGGVHDQNGYSPSRSTRRDNVDSGQGRSWDVPCHSPSPAATLSDSRASHSSHYPSSEGRALYSSPSSNSISGTRYSDSTLGGNKSHSPSPSRSVSSTNSSPSKYTWPYHREESYTDLDRSTTRSRNNSVSSNSSSVTSAGQTPQSRTRTFVLTSGSRKDTSSGGERSRSPSAPRAPSAKVSDIEYK